jgi:hypothetical protein
MLHGVTLQLNQNNNNNNNNLYFSHHKHTFTVGQCYYKFN